MTALGLFQRTMEGWRSSREAENWGLLGIEVEGTKEVASGSLCDQYPSCRFLGSLVLGPSQVCPTEGAFPILTKGCRAGYRAVRICTRRQAEGQRHAAEAAPAPALI